MDAAQVARKLMSSRLLHSVAAAWQVTDIFLTGGSLRDRLLGVPTHDLDLVVPAGANECARALAAAFAGTAFTLGHPPKASHRVVAGRLQLDVWQADGTFREDVLRRDFTVNALFWRLPRGPLIDLVDGLEDLWAGRIRVVRPKNLAIDPVRVLRGVRLLATRPPLKLTLETERHLAAAAPGLTGVAHERVLDELRGLLAGPEVERALLAAARLGLLAPLLPTWRDLVGPPIELAAVARELAAARHTTRPLAEGAREAALAVIAAPGGGFPARWDREAATADLLRLGVSRQAAQRTAASAAVGERLAAVLGRDRAEERALAVEAGPLLPAAMAWACARTAAMGASRLAEARALLRWAQAFERRPPLLSGEELAAACDLPADERRGEAIRRLRLAQARGLVRSRAQALAFLGQSLAR